jgi:hypothetical protein
VRRSCFVYELSFWVCRPPVTRWVCSDHVCALIDEKSALVVNSYLEVGSSELFLFKVLPRDNYNFLMPDILALLM